MFGHMKFPTRIWIFHAALVLVGGLLTALVFRDMWAWFVKPLGVTSLTYWHAYGLAMLLRFGTMSLPNGKTELLLGAAEERNANKGERLHFCAHVLTWYVAVPLAVWATGYFCAYNITR